MNAPGTPANLTVRVISNHGIDLLVRHNEYGHFNAQPLKKHGLVVCGDSAICTAPAVPPKEYADSHTPHRESLRMLELVERTCVLQRTDRRGNAKPIAANLTQLVAVTAPSPPFDPLLIDRYTIAARHMNVKLVLVINKTDLLSSPDAAGSAAAIEALYQSIGYPVVRCNARGGEGLSQLAQVLKGEISILVGQSGVGKSSILNGLLPGNSAKTGALSENSGLGKHTTTVTTWYDLPAGGAIIDSAGVRQFALEHLSGVDIEAGFIEIADAAAHCRFRDCRHDGEPDCAVHAGLEQKIISPQRLAHFHTITAESAGENDFAVKKTRSPRDLNQ